MPNQSVNPGTSQPHDLQRDGQDDHEIRAALQGQQVDQFILDAVLAQYLQSLGETADPHLQQINDMVLEGGATGAVVNRAIYEGLMLSTMAAVADDQAYEVALESLAPASESIVDKIRSDIFASGLQAACKHVGGSTERGQMKRRSTAFAEHLSGVVA